MRKRSVKSPFNVCNFILLLVICFHLIDFVFCFSFDICTVVTGVVYELDGETKVSQSDSSSNASNPYLFLGCEFHDVGANRVHKVLRVGCNNENVIICR
jgi:hypothetical protein